jgi:HSP20 family molecular chaperone IbpA
MFNVEEETQRIEELYRRLTGAEPRKTGAGTPIPEDANAETYVRDRLERLRSLLLLTPLAPWTPAAPVVAPRIALRQDHEEWTCTVELPGVHKADVAVRYAQDSIRVSALRRAPVGVPGMPAFAEFGGCQYERVIPLPRDARLESASASLQEGLLTVRLPVHAGAVAGEIEIGVA